MPLEGLEKVLAFLGNLAQIPGYATPQILYQGPIDGLPGYVTREIDGTLQSTAFAVENGRVTGIYIMRNPDKLRHLPF